MLLSHNCPEPAGVVNLPPPYLRNNTRPVPRHQQHFSRLRVPCIGLTRRPAPVWSRGCAVRLPRYFSGMVCPLLHPPAAHSAPKGSCGPGSSGGGARPPTAPSAQSSVERYGTAMVAGMIEYRSASCAVPPMAWPVSTRCIRVAPQCVPTARICFEYRIQRNSHWTSLSRKWQPHRL
jgi:hypothetical protein